MSTPADVVSQMIAALVDETSKARRRTHANTANTALRQMIETQPLATTAEYERRGYENGWFAAMKLLRSVQASVEEPLRKASYGDEIRHATGAINALLYYADTVVTEFEKRANTAIRTSGREEAL